MHTLLDFFLDYLWIKFDYQLVKRSLEDDTPAERNSFILRVTGGVLVAVLLLIWLF